MKTVNCRNVEMCIFCKHWRGKKPQVDYRTGESQICLVKGQCVLDRTGKYYESDDLCNHFDKSIVYM